MPGARTDPSNAATEVAYDQMMRAAFGVIRFLNRWSVGSAQTVRLTPGVLVACWSTAQAKEGLHG